ncbi:MAG: DUF1002 domain-containing protein [Lachnospiraceae bacterium]|nr:DUF1002 domain-containing protein [Lachnospiraceae bacterium]
MKRSLKRIIQSMAVIFAVYMLMGISAFAADKDTVVALGADLNASQRATVLSLMGMTEEDLTKCTVITVTNADEHQFLDGYIDSSVIGTKALTSVKMTKAAAGSGITVTTQNVNYCTTGMYRNALLTAGVEDRDVLVVAPTPVSGTAGLIGAVKAYEASTGTVIKSEVLDGALDEMITTGELTEQIENANSEDVEALIAWLKNMIATGKLDTSDENSIRSTIAEGEKQFGVTLTDEEKQQIVDLLKKLDALGLNGTYLIGQAENLYKQYGSDVVNQAQDVINEAVGNAVSQATKSFFSSIKDSFTGFFTGLFGR